tara:strand:- start:380 stop:922 length:543 start_codon:yes stop_codon:yes gene_type:complete
MPADAITASTLYQASGLTRDDFKQLVRRGLMVNSGQSGPSENSSKIYCPMSIYEVAILAELHRSGLPWPKASEVFKSFTWEISASESGEKLPEITQGSANYKKAILEYRDINDPVYLVYHFNGQYQIAACEVAYGEDGYHTLANVIERLEKNDGINSVGVLNLTALLAKTDEVIAALGSE